MFYLSQFQMKHQGKKLVTEVRKQVDKRKVCSHCINKVAIFYFTTISMTTVGSIMVVAHKCLYCILFNIVDLRKITAIFYFTFISLTTVESMVTVADECLYCILFNMTG